VRRVDTPSERWEHEALRGAAEARVKAGEHRARVILFKPGGKYMYEEEWAVPASAIGPADMGASPDFRRVSGGPVLVPSQEPWGFPHLFPGTTTS
jgi:hypothetical protein